MRNLLAACLAAGLLVAFVPAMGAKPPVTPNKIVVAYDIPGVGSGLHFSSDVVADIFLGNITHWNDSRITKLNPGTNFPNTPIVPFHRSDSCAVTARFTAYLSSASARWKKTVGSGKTVKWPKGLGGKGDPGVAAEIKQAPGGIGYLTLSYAVKYSVFYTSLPTQKTQFISPARLNPTHTSNLSGRPSRK
jgi:phosphate transport system substrate-binding protein